MARSSRHARRLPPPRVVFDFQRQELSTQADLWRERVTDLARRYTPGQLPANVDVLATLEALLHAWSQEIEQGRKAQVAAFTIDTTIQAPFWPPATGRRGSR